MDDNIHRKVLDLLGFEEILTDKKNNGIALYRRWKGGFIRETFVYYDEPSFAKLWAQAPTLDALMLPLMDYMRQECHVVIRPRRDDYHANAVNYSRIVKSVGKTLPIAIAALFIAAVEAGLIDGKAVVL